MLKQGVPLLFVFASFALQAAPIDGYKLAEWATGHERLRNTPAGEYKSLVDTVGGAKMIGYVSGVIDADNQKNICIPERVDLGQQAIVVEKWIDDHREELQQRGDTLVVEALSGPYPCPT